MRKLLVLLKTLSIQRKLLSDSALNVMRPLVKKIIFDNNFQHFYSCVFVSFEWKRNKLLNFINHGSEKLKRISKKQGEDFSTDKWPQVAPRSPADFLIIGGSPLKRYNIRDRLPSFHARISVQVQLEHWNYNTAKN